MTRHSAKWPISHSLRHAGTETVHRKLVSKTHLGRRNGYGVMRRVGKSLVFELNVHVPPVAPIDRHLRELWTEHLNPSRPTKTGCWLPKASQLFLASSRLMGT